MTVTNLSATRQEWLRQEAITALESGRWKDVKKVVARVRKRWTWATDTEIHSAIDQLHEQGRLDSRIKEVDPGLGSVDRVAWVTQWRLLPPTPG
jgi:hypothetical protein